MDAGVLFAQLRIRPVLQDRIRQAQNQDDTMLRLISEVLAGKESEYSVDTEGNLRYKDQLCIASNDKLKKEILEEAHCSAYSVHPGATKMYRDLKLLYWWPGMKREVAEFVSRCLTCQQVKAEHQKPAGEL